MFLDAPIRAPEYTTRAIQNQWVNNSCRNLRAEIASDSNTTVFIDGPQLCMKAFQAYDLVENFQTVYGTTTVVNETCVEVAGLEPAMIGVLAATLNGLGACGGLLNQTRALLCQIFSFERLGARHLSIRSLSYSVAVG